MTKPAIKVEGLWKEYVIGAQQKAHSTFYDMLSSSMSAPFRALRKRTTEEQEAESFWALRDVNFEVQPGEVVGIIGRNGAGKSTLLKILSRITAPTRGHVEVRGRLASLLEVGTGFHPELSGRENIFLNGAILGMTRAEVLRKFDEIVAFAEIEKFVDTPVKRYSSGMYVRLAFAVAAHLEPDVLVVDEVLAVGDADFQKRCLGKMRDVASRGRTVLFVSHNLSAVQMLCPVCLLMAEGRLISSGPTAKVIPVFAGATGGAMGLTQQKTGAVDLIDVESEYTDDVAGSSWVVVVAQIQVLRGTHELYVDFGLETERGVRLFQVMPRSRGLMPIHAAGGDVVHVKISIPSVTLGPGRYLGTVFVHSPHEGALLHVSEVPLFVAAARSDRPECMSPLFTALLVPDFLVDINIRPNRVA